ncbi:Hsp20 family protein [Reinekea blandensis]|uniref:Molecular chaperone (Small heat shock protein) n=1 Tax=Reinekea blandensis MED297 TaxID=314283 RepID=A4BDK6_9GAMM|nr:Hsp20 family protein [Reinekea blandensis]EAR09950.1 Molecular chaperone (small heat shock protein) [Reinekea sp. MED297] [Reinekea blandensis MED297]
MNAIDLTPLYRSSIGFDRLANLLDSAFSVDSNTSTYPPYNIESLDDNRYAITLAVAGFKEEDIEIVVEKGVLSVKGKKDADEKRKYLHQGIANRAFERKFNLADFVEVTGAELVNGLLTISLVKEVPEEMKPKKISISSDTRVLEHSRGDEGGNDKAA